jgi:hypothetical protein
MTAETDLLPLPEGYAAWYYIGSTHVYSAGEMESYARANVAHAVAPLQAEIEALRAEVERANSWNERVSVCRDHVADIVDGPCVICALDAAKARADKLAEVLREAKEKMLARVKWVACDCGCEGEKPADAVSIAWLRASALLREQEEGK